MLLFAFLLIALATMFASYRLARRGPGVAKGATAALCGMLVARFVLALRPDWEWALFPWPDYAYAQGFTVYALAAVFFAVAAASLHVRWNRFVVVCVGVSVLCHGAIRHAWLAWPEVHGDERFAGADHHLRQSTHYTCGPAACAAALSHCGVKISERELAAACLTRRVGSNLFDLYRGIVCTLHDPRFAVSIEDLTPEQLVAQDQVVVGSNASRGHALCVAVVRGEITVHDPLATAAERGSLQFLRERFRSPAIVIRAREGNEGASPPQPLR